MRVGLVTPKFCEILTTHAPTTFELTQNNQLLFTQPLRDSSNVEKSNALNEVNRKLCDLGIIKGWRNDFLTVSDSFSTTYSATTFPTTDSSTDAITDTTPLLIERAAYPFYGIKAYGIHVNGFTRDRVTKRITGLWIAKRSMYKSNWPGDYCEIGALQYDMSFFDDCILCEDDCNGRGYPIIACEESVRSLCDD